MVGVPGAVVCQNWYFATDMNIIVGVNHNIPVLRDIITQPKFVSGDITTNFIKDVYPNGFKGTIKPCL